MRQSKVLGKIRTGRCARICGLGHYLPFFVRYAAQSGYDGIWLDLEHRAMDDREVQSVLSLAHHNDIDCMVRPQTLERTRLYRYLEDGATGFMFPFARYWTYFRRRSLISEVSRMRVHGIASLWGGYLSLVAANYCYFWTECRWEDSGA
mgnify:CR=1 FL=1